MKSFRNVIVIVFISLPFLFLKIQFFLLVLFLLSLLQFLYGLKLKSKLRSLIFTAFLSLTISLSSYFLFIIYEGGLAMGPNYGQSFEKNTEDLIPSDSVDYKSGKLVSFSKGLTHSPVIIYKEDDEIIWAHEFTDNMDINISEVIEFKIQNGLIRDKIIFFATGWSEPGWVYIWKFGGVNRFYVRMF